MKIMHVTWSFCNGGIETMLVNIMNHQAISGHEVLLMVVNDRYDDNLLSTINPNVRICRIDRHEGSYNPLPFMRMNMVYRTFGADIVHFHQLSLVRLFFKSRNNMWFYTQHCIPQRLYKDKRLESYIAISQCVADKVNRLLPTVNCRLCYNGVDFSRMSPKTEYSSTCNRIAVVSRMDIGIKGQDVIIRAISLLPENLRKELRVDIYGDGPDFQKMRDLVVSLDLQESVILRGNVRNAYLLEHLKDYDLFIQASRIEGFGLSAVEAMGCGIPVILSEIPGHLEISKNGSVATMFESENAERLALRIIECCKEYSIKVDLAKKARKHVLEAFSIEKMVDTLLDIYEGRK